MFFIIIIFHGVISQNSTLKVYGEIKIENNFLNNDNEITSPSLNFSTFHGGNNYDISYSIDIDNWGNTYLIGSTRSIDFPTKNAYQNSFGGGNFWENDVFVSKYSSNGSLLWSTYFGGVENDEGLDVAIDKDGNCYITGETNSNNFPVKNAFNYTFGGNYDAFVSKFSTNGSLLWSTFLGGNKFDCGHGVAVDNSGNCYIGGSTSSNNFPTLNGFNHTYGNYSDAFISKFSASGVLLWSTFLGGKKFDYSHSIAVDEDGNCFITGYTESINFPVSNAYQEVKQGNFEAFISKLSSTGSLLWSTYFGGTNKDWGTDVAVDKSGNCYVIGDTESINLPVKNAHQSVLNGLSDVFISKFSTKGALAWSTLLGGSDYEFAWNVDVATDGGCYLVGKTYSINFPVRAAFQEMLNVQYDGFVSRFSSSGTLLWSTYLGGDYDDSARGIAVDKEGHCYVSGLTESSNFPVKNAFQNTKSDDYDAYVLKFNPYSPKIVKNYINVIIIAFSFWVILCFILKQQKKYKEIQ